MIVYHPEVAALKARQDVERARALTAYGAARDAVTAAKADYVAACDSIAALKARHAAELDALVGGLDA